MRFSYFDDAAINKTGLNKKEISLQTYRKAVNKVVSIHDPKKPEYSLVYGMEPSLHETLASVSKQYRTIKHLIVVGIGGSSLGIEAIHTALGQKKVKLSVLDTIAPYELDILLQSLVQYKKKTDLAICVISKSGTTTETLINTDILLTGLEKKFGKTIYSQVISIGNPGTEVAKYFKRKKATILTMPEIVGGRYSVVTEVGLVPMTLLGHDVDSFIAGAMDANSEEFETVAVDGAIRIASYVEKDYQHYNFFAFDKRLALVGAWYRQLFAESLGKETTKDKKKFTKGMLPTITTAVELHSVGQLYLSGFKGVYTDFVTFDDVDHEHSVSKTGLAKQYGSFSDQDVAVAIYGGVMKAYQQRQLPYRSVIFDEDNLEYSLGLFMALRMREMMYAANLLNLNAFNQPNVELYKKETKKVLGL